MSSWSAQAASALGFNNQQAQQVASVLGGFSAGLVRQQARGGKFELGTLAADSFGQMIGQALLAQTSQADQQTQPLHQAQQRQQQAIATQENSFDDGSMAQALGYSPTRAYLNEGMGINPYRSGLSLGYGGNLNDLYPVTGNAAEESGMTLAEMQAIGATGQGISEEAYSDFNNTAQRVAQAQGLTARPANYVNGIDNPDTWQTAVRGDRLSIRQANTGQSIEENWAIARQLEDQNADLKAATRENQRQNWIQQQNTIGEKVQSDYYANNPVRVTVEDLPTYQSLQQHLEASQRADETFYQDHTDNATSAAEAIGSRIGLAFNKAGYGLANGAVGLYGLATDSNLREHAWEGLKYTASHPLDTISDVASNTVYYFQSHHFQQIADEPSHRNGERLAL